MSKSEEKTPLKISLTGSAGTGRTIIARRLASKLQLPLITGVAKTILKLENYEYTQSVSIEKFLATPERQHKISTYRQQRESEYESFVTDRSWLDQATYAIIELNGCVGFDVTSYLDDCRDEAEKTTLTVYVPWNRRPLTHDGVRTVNPWYQLLVDSVVFNLLNKWEVPHLILPADLSVKAAVKTILEHLGKAS